MSATKNTSRTTASLNQFTIAITVGVCLLLCAFQCYSAGNCLVQQNCV
ncbi:MAG: hypothetical protein ACLT3Y_02065 [Ruminococcus callidus]